MQFLALSIFQKVAVNFEEQNKNKAGLKFVLRLRTRMFGSRFTDYCYFSVQRTPFQGVRNFSFNLPSRIGQKNNKQPHLLYPHTPPPISPLTPLDDSHLIFWLDPPSFMTKKSPR